MDSCLHLIIGNLKLPAWADIKKELPWWLGGGTDETKTPLQAFKDEFSDTTWTFTLPTWASIKSFIPKWFRRH